MIAIEPAAALLGRAGTPHKAKTTARKTVRIDGHLILKLQQPESIRSLN